MPVRIVGSGPEPGTFDLAPPALALAPRDGVGPLLSSALCEGLTRLDAQGVPRRGLASLWTHQAFTDWLFALRPGVSAHDLAAYLMWLCDPSGPYASSPLLLDTFGLVASWEARSPSVLTARLRFPCLVFPRLLCDPQWRVPASVSGVSPPYDVVAVSERPAPVVRLAPRTEAASADLEIRVVPSSSERSSLVFAGRADVALSVAGPRLRTLSLGAGERLARFAWEVCPAFVIRPGSPLGADPRLALALKTLLAPSPDLLSAYSGYAEPACGAPLPSAVSPGFLDLPCALGAAEASEVLRAYVARHGPMQLAAYFDEQRALALHASRMLWRRHGVDCSSVYHEVGYPGFFDRPFVVFPWRRSPDPRLLLRLLADPRWSSVSWFRPALEPVLRDLLAVPSVAEASAAFATLVTDFSCRASAFVPCLPDRVDLLGPGVALPPLPASSASFSPDAFVRSVSAS